MKFPEWHFIKNADYPENYLEFKTYSYKSHEYTHPVLVATKYMTFKVTRRRLTTEENFSWVPNKSNKGTIKFKPEELIMWTFLPTQKYLKQIIKNEGLE